jgi:ABC-type branched-subunit amino acid transport system ATPase component
MLDEPTSGVHGVEQDRVSAVLKEVKTMGVTVLLVEHHMHVVRAHADRVVALQAGRVLRVGTPQDVLDSDIFRAAIVGGGGTKHG